MPLGKYKQCYEATKTTSHAAARETEPLAFTVVKNRGLLHKSTENRTKICHVHEYLATIAEGRFKSYRYSPCPRRLLLPPGLRPQSSWLVGGGARTPVDAMSATAEAAPLLIGASSDGGL